MFHGRRPAVATRIAASQRLAGFCRPVQPTADSRQPTACRRGITLVEMLIAMAITIVMMGTVVTLFANISNSVRNRRATIEMSGQMRHVRNMLQQDLQGATCPGLVWQRPESNHGYIELIEGPYREGNASILVNSNGVDINMPSALDPEIDHETSIIPTSNLLDTSVPERANWVTDGGGLGDYDDVLMFTSRNEHEPFVGRVPTNVRPNATQAAEFDVDDTTPEWDSETVESPLAEVVWFSIENPAEAEDADGFFGEPGMRTVYRRTLLIAPWVNPYRYTNPSPTSTAPPVDTFMDSGDTFKAEPGLVRILRDNVNRENLDQALAALIAFQDRYDLSVRLEFDSRLGSDGRYKIVANTLGDLTKRENRFGHYGFYVNNGEFSRIYPYAALSIGSMYEGDGLAFVVDPEAGGSSTSPPRATANLDPNQNESVRSYRIDEPGSGFATRPFVYIDDDSSVPATPNAMLNDDGSVIRVIHGPVPLWGTRRGEDVMLSDVLAFDLRVYDPGAPLFRHIESDTVLEPADPSWATAYLHKDNMDGIAGNGWIGTDDNVFPFAGQGAYVDLGYGFDTRSATPALPSPRYASAFTSSALPWFFTPRALSDVYLSARPAGQEFLSQLAPGYAVYDTWSFHYENNGLDEDGDGLIDEGTNGLDSPGHYPDSLNPQVRLGVDDVGERETAPPYDKPLRGMQVLLRAYERDSRQIRQIRVNQHFMPE